jgi:hypothetical protein
VTESLSSRIANGFMKRLEKQTNMNFTPMPESVDLDGMEIKATNNTLQDSS